MYYDWTAGVLNEWTLGGVNNTHSNDFVLILYGKNIKLLSDKSGEVKYSTDLPFTLFSKPLTNWSYIIYMNNAVDITETNDPKDAI